MNVFPSKFRFSFVKDGEITYCKYSPEDWNDNVVNWNRDKDNAEILVKYTTSFSFIMDDADYLRECFNMESVFAKVLFVVEQYDYGKFEYHAYYTGDIDFYSYEESEFKVSIVTTNIGYRASVLANMDTTYEIEIPQLTDIVRYDRLQLMSSLKYSGDIEVGDLIFGEAVPSLFIVIEEVYRNSIEAQNVMGPNVNWIDGNMSDLWMCKALEDVYLDISIKYDITFTPHSGFNNTQTTNFEFIIGENIKDGTRITIDSKDIYSKGGPVVFSGDKTISGKLSMGDRLYLRFHIPNALRIKSIKNNSPINLEVTYKNKSIKNMDISGIRPLNLLKQLISKATGGKYNNVKSNLLITGEVSRMLITSGDRVRRIPGSKIKTSLKDFFKAMNVMFGASYTFKMIDGEEVLEVEHLNYFYDQNTVITEVEDITDITKKVKDALIYNKLKVGYEDQTYDEVNGKREFNTTLEFAINSDHNGKGLNLISPYRADMYGVEFTIIDYERQETTDSDNDNDVFVFHTGSNVYDNGFLMANVYELNRDFKILDPANLAGDTAFNVYLSPKRCLLRQIEYIKSLFMFSGTMLEFTSSPKDSAGKLIEHANVNLENCTSLFKPISYEFETMVPGNISELINANYRGYVLARDGDRVIKGFIDSVSENPGGNKSQKWKLLEVGH